MQRRFWTLGTLIVVFVLGPPLAAPARAAGLLIPAGADRSLAIESQKVDVRINNGVAVTTVTQVFRNDSPQALEALYTFPVPREASVSNFSLWVAGNEVVGEVLAREQARRIYQQVTRVERKDPGLLEQVDFKTFEMRVFPVPARGTQQIQISYYQPVDYDSGFATFVYPLEMDEQTVSQMTGALTLSVDLVSEVPLKRTWSPSHGDALVTAEMKPGHYRAGIEVPQGSLARDFVLVYELEREPIGINLVSSRTDDDNGYFMLLVTPGPRFDESKKQVNLTFVLDVSGSMEEAGKLDLARQAVVEGLSLLRKTDTFNVVVFNIAPVSLFERPMPADEANRRSAAEFLTSLVGRGGTDIIPALEEAMSMRRDDARNAVLLLSDGQATDMDEHSAFIDAMKRGAADAHIFSFGIGNEINRPLLDRLAYETGGLADYVSGQDEIARKMRLMQAKLVSEAALDLQLKIEGVRVEDIYPRKIPNLYRGQQLVLFGRYQGSGESKLTLSGTFLGKHEVLTAKLDFPEQNKDNPQIERMWALRKVDSLLSEVRASGETPRLVEQVVEVGTKYSIVTPYTAFLVLENEAEYQRFSIERRNLARLESERAAGVRFQQTAPAATIARDITWSGDTAPAATAPPEENLGGSGNASGNADGSGDGNGGGNGGGAVEWLFLAGAGLLAAGRSVAARRRNAQG